MRDRFGEWEHLTDYWNVHDVEDVGPAEALPLLAQEGRYFYLLADRRRRQRSTSFPRRAKRPCNGHLGALIEATSPDRTIAEARTR